jgi:hypothetical protein
MYFYMVSITTDYRMSTGLTDCMTVRTFLAEPAESNRMQISDANILRKSRFPLCFIRVNRNVIHQTGGMNCSERTRFSRKIA